MLEPIAIPALESNYFWLLPAGPESPDAYLVDPGDAAPVFKALRENQLTLRAILVTHHHWDHTDGLDELLAQYPVPVYGPDSVPQVTVPMKQGDRVALPGADLSVLAVPGHTLDHLAYYQAPEHGGPRVFCGDALFAAGCGRLFEGTPAQALNSLESLNALPAETRIYCAHEYTHTNLRFAHSVDPENEAVTIRLASVEKTRRQGERTLPSELSLERETNPFLRTGSRGIRNTLGLNPSASNEAVFAELRRRKDAFR